MQDRTTVQEMQPQQQQQQTLTRNDETHRLIGLDEATSWAPASARPPAYAQVVIVGSGLAGLAAAQRLHELGLQDDVIVLEAQNRPGGRVHTIGHSNYLLELGAQWLHGADENPLYKWLNELDMLDDFEDATLGFAGKFCTSNKRVIEPELVNRMLAVVNKSKLALFKDENLKLNSKLDANNNNNNNNNGPQSASQVFKSQLNVEIERDSLLKRNKQLVLALFEWFLRYECIENGCDSMDQVSLQSYTNYADCGDGTLLNFKRGYSSLLAWFCEHFSANKSLYLNKQVLNINSSACSASGEGRIQIKFINSNVSLEEQQQQQQAPYLIECDHVIVTSSLGFLKQNMDTLFTPHLPESKRLLIKSIGFGTVNKIVLQFERPFWQESGIKLIWSEEDEDGKELLACDFPTWVRDIIAFDVVRRQPNLLIGWIGGQGARAMETHSDQEVGQICLRLLERFLPLQPKQLRPTRLLACLCSRWNSNPFTCGSYSFQSMSSLDLNMDKLHEPLYGLQEQQQQQHQQVTNPHELAEGQNQQITLKKRMPRVLFAGEATAGRIYSTTHGAIISGWREADRLAEHLSLKQRHIK